MILEELRRAAGLTSRYVWGHAGYPVTFEGCWVWQGPLDTRGAPTTGNKRARRILYEAMYGRPDQKFIVDTCGNDRCVNPTHAIPYHKRMYSMPLRYKPYRKAHVMMSIDPATSGGCGVAVFKVTDINWTLVHVTTIYGNAAKVKRELTRIKDEHNVTYVVGEKPMKYAKDRASHAAVDVLLDVLAHANPDKTFYPARWKGNVPKSVHHRRMLSLGVLPDEVKELDHNALDAVALGLYALGVIDRGAANAVGQNRGRAGQSETLRSEEGE